jgi:hypothetical protein
MIYYYYYIYKEIILYSKLILSNNFTCEIVYVDIYIAK